MVAVLACEVIIPLCKAIPYTHTQRERERERARETQRERERGVTTAGVRV